MSAVAEFLGKNPELGVLIAIGIGTWVGGFKYKDSDGANGPVKQAQIKKSRKGTFTLKFKASGKLSPVSVVPPDPGDSGCILLELAGGDSYSVRFAPGDGEVSNKDGTSFKVKKPLSEGSCVTTTTTSTSNPTSSTTSTSSTTTTTSSPTTSTGTARSRPTATRSCGSSSGRA